MQSLSVFLDIAKMLISGVSGEKILILAELEKVLRDL